MLPRAGGMRSPRSIVILLVRFTAPTLDHAAELRFRYRLDDGDAEWTDSGGLRIAQFTDLPPGRHAFRVQAMAPFASDFGPEATFVVDMAARFDETLTFRLSLVALGVALLYGAYRLRLAGSSSVRPSSRARSRCARASWRTAQGELVVVNAEPRALNVDLERRVAVAVDELVGRAHGGLWAHGRGRRARGAAAAVRARHDRRTCSATSSAIAPT